MQKLDPRYKPTVSDNKARFMMRTASTNHLQQNWLSQNPSHNAKNWGKYHPDLMNVKSFQDVTNFINSNNTTTVAANTVVGNKRSGPPLNNPIVKK